MSEATFKERVKNIAIKESKNYKRYFVDYNYLVCSNAFTEKDYYIIDAREDNYQHLLGVSSLLSPQSFFDKCYDGTLQEAEFDFQRHGQSEKSIKGSVRRKITALPHIINMFNGCVKVQETFVKNQISCSFATSDNTFTLGFISTPNSHPMTLLKNNELDKMKMRDVSLMLRKSKSKEKFDEIIVGDIEILLGYYEKIKDYVDENLIQSLLTSSQAQTAATKE